MVYNAHDKEQEARETIQSLKLEITNLSQLIKHGVGMSMGEQQSIGELIKVKDDLTRERDEQYNEISKLRTELSKIQEEQHRVDQERSVAMEKIKELSQEIQVKQTEAQREVRKKEKLERELRQMKDQIELRTSELKTMQTQMESSKKEISKMEVTIKEQKNDLDRLLRENDNLAQKLLKIHADVEGQASHADQMSKENADKIAEIKAKDEAIYQMKQETSRLTKQRDNIQRKLKLIEDQKVEVDAQKELLRGQIAVLDRELELAKKFRDTDKKAIEDLQRERDQLNKTIVKAQTATAKQIDLVKHHEQTRKGLEKDINGLQEEVYKQKKLIFELEKERDLHIKKANEYAEKAQSTADQIKVKENVIQDMKKSLSEGAHQLKQQQNIYEACRTDRNLYSKNLVESQDEIADLKRKMKVMSHQIEQLNETIMAKEALLVQANLEYQKLEKHKDSLKDELQAMKRHAKERKDLIDRQEQEQKKLTKIINEADAERMKQKKELDKVINERDTLGTQLVRKNDELNLLYEKIKIQESTLSKGEAQYQHRMEDIRVMKSQLHDLQREKTLLSKNAAKAATARRELQHLQKELLREQGRIKALEEELENPMNVHRWRNLEGSDPGMFEMIQKIHMLQRRLIHKSEEVVEKELLIQEKEKLYAELKQVLARQPGPDTAEQIQILKKTLKEKTKQIKSLTSELSMFDAQAKERKLELERQQREMYDVKKRYYSQKKALQLRETSGSERVVKMPPIVSDGSQSSLRRYTGGGYRYGNPPHSALKT